MLQLVHSKSELTSAIDALLASGKTIGFVPTMGALHEGHCSLVRRAVKDNDVCVVSVFCNPTQFNNADDYAKYPRTIERDCALLEAEGVALVFNPSPEEMYSADELHTTFEFDFGGLDQVMEGKYRPGHFNGVVQVVSKLFDLVRPTRAYFGEKDFQQLAIIRRMVNVMGYDIDIVGCPIVRETSGLALSSRNERLTEQQKATAVSISHVLFESRDLTAMQSVKEVEHWVIEQINLVEGLVVEYFQIVDQTTLQPATSWDNAIGCVTVYAGDVRLIDNIKY